MDGRAVSCGIFDISDYPGTSTGTGAPGPAGPPGANGADGEDGYGVVGGGTDHILLETDIVATTSYTITTGKNALSAGPLTLDSGVVVTVPAGSVWTIV